VVFAEGALHAAEFIENRKGFYCMEDVLFQKVETETEIAPESWKFGVE
jgi:hypothetical protein